MKALKNVKFTRKTAVFIIIAAAVLLAAIVLLCAGGGGLETAADRIEYLSSLGWEVDQSSESEREVVLPETLDGVMQQYNELQKQQGFDLAPYAGRECRSYSYTRTNYPSGEAGVIAQIFVCDGEVIAGDIHSAKMGGFMHGLR